MFEIEGIFIKRLDVFRRLLCIVYRSGVILFMETIYHWWVGSIKVLRPVKPERGGGE